MADFQKERAGIINFIRQGQSEFSLFAVKASFTETIEAFLKFYQSQKTRNRIKERTFFGEDFPRKKRNITCIRNLDLVSTKKYDPVAKGTSFIQVINNE